MNYSVQKSALRAAVKAGLVAGKVMRENLHAKKKINSTSRHDIKLELDCRCQELIEKSLAADFPDVAVLGEEGVAGDPGAEYRWVVDPIDGTVNFAHGIPHACVSIALQARLHPAKRSGVIGPDSDYETITGMVYDPFCEELWSAIRGKPAYLNGAAVRVSTRRKSRESLISMGFAKTRKDMERTLPFFEQLARRVRKVRFMGSAALALTYVATGRFDAYIERGIRLWDIAAGGLIIECAGGQFWREPIAGKHSYRMIASNGVLWRKPGPVLPGWEEFIS